MKEFELTFRLRNNRLKERRIAKGLSAKKLADKLRISYTYYLSLEGLGKNARIVNKNDHKGKKKGDWTDIVKRLAKFYGVHPSELFPDSVFLVEANKAVKKVDGGDLVPMLAGDCDSLLPAEFEKSPEEILVDKENRRLAAEACEILSEREKAIVENKYIKDMNYDEADPEGCSGTRAHQISEYSIRKIQNYIRIKGLDRSHRAHFINLLSKWQFTQAARYLKGLPYKAKVEVANLAEEFGDIGLVEENGCERRGVSADDLKHIRRIVGLILSEDKSLEKGEVLKRAALISRCGDYRYWLSRYWDNVSEADTVCWVMLNPSTADGEVDDPTVRKCIGFSRQWKFGGLYIVNLFAYRATNPSKILEVESPVGKDNSKWLFKIAGRSRRVVLGWGGWIGRRDFIVKHRDYVQWVETILRQTCRHKTYQFGLTQNGQPLHPLYVRYETELEKVFG